MQIHKVLILSVSLVFGSFAHADASQLGLWERFCLNDKIGNACGRALDSLSDKMAAASSSELIHLQGRMDQVSESGCKLHDKASCEYIQGIEVEEIQAQASSEEAG